MLHGEYQRSQFLNCYQRHIVLQTVFLYIHAVKKKTKNQFIIVTCSIGTSIITIYNIRNPATRAYKSLQSYVHMFTIIAQTSAQREKKIKLKTGIGIIFT